MVKVFIVSLRGSSRRRTFMAQQFAKYGLEYEFIDAHPAEKVSDAELAIANSARPRAGTLRRPEIACVRSHAAACRAIASHAECGFGLVMEDDVVIGPHLRVVLEALAARKPAMGVTLLYGLAFRPVHLEQSARLVRPFELFSPAPLTDLWGTQAYFLSSEQAKVFCEAIVPVRARADDWAYYVTEGILPHVTIVSPFPVIHAEFDSDVRPDDQRSSILTRKGLSQLVHDRRMWPLYQLSLWVRRRRAEVRQRTYFRRQGQSLGRTFLL